MIQIIHDHISSKNKRRQCNAIIWFIFNLQSMGRLPSSHAFDLLMLLTLPPPPQENIPMVSPLRIALSHFPVQCKVHTVLNHT
jgi:hypothetical protein